MSSPPIPRLTAKALLSRVLEVLIGASAASIFSSIRMQFPPLHGAVLTLLSVTFVPPLVLLLTLAVAPRVAPFCAIVPLVLLPAVHDSHFPITALVILSLVVSLSIAAAARSPTTCAVVLLTALLGVQVPYICKALHTLIALPAPTLLVSLITTLLSLRTSSHRILVNALSPRPHSQKHSSTQNGAEQSESSRRTRGRIRYSRNKKHRDDSAASTSSSSNSIVGLCTAIALTFAITLALITLVTRPLTRAVIAVGNRKLPQHYVILSQTWSNTGLITVVEKQNSHRMLVADRSVLGGYFIMAGHEPDSIFSQFYLHEVVRLSRRSDPDPDPGEKPSMMQSGGRNGRALCIGIGVGVVTNALRFLGCPVDAVEIDPAVAAAASQWFDLRGGIHVADGMKFVSLANERVYDFVVHDAFTGGGVSAALVSEQQLYAIKRVMKDDGVLAINVVTGLSGLSIAVLTTVYDRLQRVFGHVRMFSDELDDSVNNVVVFASPVQTGVQFRKPVQTDYLGSTMRQMIFEKFEEREVFRDSLVSPLTQRLSLKSPESGNLSFIGGLLEEIELRVGLINVAWRHANVMDVAHPSALWPALLNNARLSA